MPGRSIIKDKPLAKEQMMKRIWTLLFLLVSTAVFLAACTDNQAAEAVVPTEPPGTAVATHTPSPEAAQNDLSLIGQTGRPQLLNAYASW